MKEGVVSVLMAVHNEKEAFLRTAVGSIFGQTYPHIELIIVDDASGADCQAVVDDLCNGRKNVKLLHNETNLGLTKSLNRGLALAEGEFVARMDADDFSLPTRIEKQVGYLVEHPDIDIVGTGVVSFGTESIFMSPAYGYSNDAVQCCLFFSSALCHPSVMIRKHFLDANGLKYDENVRTGQDYDLWERCSVYGRLAVMSEVLLYYRTHSAQISSTSNKNQNETSEMVQKRRLGRLGINPTDKEYRCHQLLAGNTDKMITNQDVKSWIDKVLQNNQSKKLVNQGILERDLKRRYVLYKLRNRVVLKNFALKDITIIYKIILGRVKVTMKLYSVRKQMRRIIPNEL